MIGSGDSIFALATAPGRAGVVGTGGGGGTDRTDRSDPAAAPGEAGGVS